MELLRSITLWMVIATAYIVFCYHVARLSIEVAEYWDCKEDKTASMSAGLRLMLFPHSSLNKIAGTPRETTVTSEFLRLRCSFWKYAVTQVFVLPFRVIWFVIFVGLAFVALPIGSLVIYGIARTVKGVFSLVRWAML